MKKIDIDKIRGKYTEVNTEGNIVAVGDDTVESIKIVAEKLNEIIEHLQELN